MKKIVNIVQWFILSIIGMFLIGTITASLFKINSYVVISSSMQDEIPIQSLVYARKIDSPKETIKIDDVVIAYNEGMSIPVMHKVIELSEETVTTHGISNNENVNEVFKYNDIKGVVIFIIPYIGIIKGWISNLYFWAVLILLIVLYYITKKIYKEVKKK